MTDLILHHYDGSPFAHKIRWIFGLKKLAWKSVVIPMVMPKPDLIALTGGYRKTPVLQIGADVYCDTGLIARELERRFPTPSLYPAGSGGEGLAAMLTGWADANLFLPCANYSLALIADKIPPAFFADRAAMRGQQPPDIQKYMAAAPRLLAGLQQQLARIEGALADGRPYLLGAAPGFADFSVGHPVWMLTTTGKRVAASLDPFPMTKAWIGRLAAIGQGERTEIDSKAALAAAKAGAPDAAASEADDSAPKLGTKVAVQSEDKVPEPTIGEVCLVRRDEIAVKRDDPAAGTVAVHFPRLGYAIRPV